MKRLGWFILVGCLLLALAIAYKRPADIGPPAERIVRIYEVGDLIDAPLDEPVAPLIVPASGLGPPFMGSGVGYRAPDPIDKAPLDQLIELLHTGIDPSSWGPLKGSASTFGRRLVVVQTRRNQESIASLLAELRNNPPRQIHVEVIWAKLRPEEFAGITVPPAKGGMHPVTLVNLDALAKLPGAIVWRGQSTCKNGRRTKISCGQTRTVATSVDTAFGEKEAGFIADTQQLIDGAIVDLSPALSGDGSTVLLEVRSEVTRFGPTLLPPIEFPPPRFPAGESAATVKIERLNLGVQSIETALTGPTSAAMLVGGTSDPDAATDNARRLYLIMRVSEVKR